MTGPKSKPTPDDVVHDGQLLLGVPRLHSGWEHDNRIQLWEMPDGTRFIIKYEDQRPVFMKTAEVNDLIDAYNEVVDYTETVLELFYGADKETLKRH